MIESPWDRLMSDHGHRPVRNPRIFHMQLVRSLATSLPDRTRLPWEPRYPLLYRPLVEFLVALPQRLKASARNNRILQRQALAGVLPDLVRLRRTKGDFTARFFRGLRNHWDMWGLSAPGRRLADRGIVNPAQFQEACQRLRHGEGTDSPYLAAALVMEAWLAARTRHA
jgi:asparagine synthase (glutamine-hydrolysing)